MLPLLMLQLLKNKRKVKGEMMFVQKSHLEVKTDTGRNYSLQCQPDSPLEEVKIVLKEMEKMIVKFLESKSEEALNEAEEKVEE